MQRKERTWNELKPQMAEKEWKTKMGKKNKDNKQKTVKSMVDLNPVNQ